MARGRFADKHEVRIMASLSDHRMIFVFNAECVDWRLFERHHLIPYLLHFFMLIFHYCSITIYRNNHY